ncbi:MAG: D-alanine--D-alanine ligase [Gammaproteobacteria bacterium]|nr:D-alanine--D-alanine ligase [Gammaproteobacteria bacterium]
MEKISTYDYGKVAVLMGGDSAEREISLDTGMAVYESLVRTGIDAYRFDPSNVSLFELKQGNFNRAFIALHGRGGEDGTIQGALQTLGIPYTGSGVLGSALCMDKVRSKLVWNATNLPTPDFLYINSDKDLEKIPEVLGFPVVIKPVSEGSSVGVSIVKNNEQLQAAWRNACETDNQAMAEKWIDGDEYTATVLLDKVLPMIQLKTPREFYDYEAKYHADTTEYLCPCDLGEEHEARLAELVFKAFFSLSASGWGRVDFMMDRAGNPWFIELNTVPGMTSHSLVPMSARQAGYSFEELVLMILYTSVYIERSKGISFQ